VTELGSTGNPTPNIPTLGCRNTTPDSANTRVFATRILYALLLRAGGATAIMPHVLGQSSQQPRDNLEILAMNLTRRRLAEDPAKAQTQAFIDTLKLLDNLTDAQIKELACLGLSL